jgi:hypothetical protein
MALRAILIDDGRDIRMEGWSLRPNGCNTERQEQGNQECKTVHFLKVRNPANLEANFAFRFNQKPCDLWHYARNASSFFAHFAFGELVSQQDPRHLGQLCEASHKRNIIGALR